MAHFLDINQLAEEASERGLADVVSFLTVAAQAVAEAIAKERGDVAIVSDASNEPGFGGLCVGFGPIKDGDECPEDFAHYDESSDWAQGELEGFTCKGCGRPESECSVAPCEAVLADREA